MKGGPSYLYRARVAHAPGGRWKSERKCSEQTITTNYFDLYADALQDAKYWVNLR